MTSGQIKFLTLMFTLVNVWLLFHIPAVSNAMLKFISVGEVPGTGKSLSPNTMLYLACGVFALAVIVIFWREFRKLFGIKLRLRLPAPTMPSLPRVPVLPTVLRRAPLHVKPTALRVWCWVLPRTVRAWVLMCRVTVSMWLLAAAGWRWLDPRIRTIDRWLEKRLRSNKTTAELIKTGSVAGAVIAENLRKLLHGLRNFRDGAAKAWRATNR